jgi:hypothetical protein
MVKTPSPFDLLTEEKTQEPDDFLLYEVKSTQCGVCTNIADASMTMPNGGRWDLLMASNFARVTGSRCWIRPKVTLIISSSLSIVLRNQEPLTACATTHL